MKKHWYDCCVIKCMTAVIAVLLAPKISFADGHECGPYAGNAQCPSGTVCERVTMTNGYFKCVPTTIPCKDFFRRSINNGNWQVIQNCSGNNINNLLGNVVYSGDGWNVSGCSCSYSEYDSDLRCIKTTVWWSPGGPDWDNSASPQLQFNPVYGYSCQKCDAGTRPHFLDLDTGWANFSCMYRENSTSGASPYTACSCQPISGDALTCSNGCEINYPINNPNAIPAACNISASGTSAWRNNGSGICKPSLTKTYTDSVGTFRLGDAICQ